jgi:hypothetical protein
MACLCRIEDCRADRVGPAGGQLEDRAQVKAEPTRRLVLAAAGAAALTLAGCKGIAVLGPRPKPGSDVLTLEHSIAAEELMIARYQSALAALANAAGTKPASKADQRDKALVTEVLAEHRAHLVQLKARLILPPRLATASPRPRPTAPPPPAERRRMLAGLATAEAAASDRLIGQLAAVPPELAQLMASIAASEAAHVVLLGYGRLAP